MALPFVVTVMPPYLIVYPTDVAEDVVATNTFGTWAEVMQVNSSTAGIAVGDIVFYIQNSVPTVTYTKDGTAYSVIDESNVLFIAP